MTKENMIVQRSDAVYNATIETLAMMLFFDRNQGARAWWYSGHEEREKYRAMAEGRAEIT